MIIASFDMGVRNYSWYVESDGKRIAWELLSLSRTGKLTMEARKKLFQLLEEHRELWEQVTDIVIEQQYYTVGSVNLDALKLSELTLGWFLCQYPEKKICIFPSANKTRMMGAPSGLTKPQRKKWGVSKTTELLKEMEDGEGLELLEGVKKKDDMADSFLQCQAYKKRLNKLG